VGAGVFAAPPAPLAQSAVNPASPKAPIPLYFINAPLDYALVGLLSILAFTILSLADKTERTTVIVLLAAKLAWVCNWPHFAATSYRLYQSKDNIRQYPLTALVIPWLVLAAVFASIASPGTIAPCFVMIFLIWSPYHFSGQTVGVSMIYARRAGFFVGKPERFALSGFVFATYLTQTIRSQVDARTLDYYQIPYTNLGLPPWTFIVSEVWMYLCMLLLILLVARWCIQNKRILPPIVLLPAAAQYTWFVLGANVPAFNEFVPFFHSLQYLLIAWSMQLKEKLDREHIPPSTNYVVSESVRWGLLNFCGGVFLFWIFPYALNRFFGVNEMLALGVTAAGVQIHHFFVDGVIWKLKRKTVASPLMVNISEMLTPAGGAPAVGLTAAPVLSMEQKA
jgi:hypothetical protein